MYQISWDNNSSEYGRLVIDYNYSGYGYGFQATEAALIVAKKIGIRTVNLDVYTNNYAAIKTYKKCCFNEIGTSYDNSGTKMIRMSIAI